MGIQPRRNPIPPHPLKIDAILACEECPPLLQGRVRGPPRNPERADGKFGTQGNVKCFCCSFRERDATHDVTHEEFKRNHGKIEAGNPALRTHIIVHPEPMCRNMKLIVMRHVSTRPHLQWMLEPDPDYVPV